MLTITPKDALRSTVVTPGQYRCRVTNVYNKPAATDGSMLTKFELEIVYQRGTKNEQFKGVPIKDVQISEKAVGFGIPFLLACGFPVAELEKIKRGEAGQVDEMKCLGVELYAQVATKIFDGRPQNEAVDFFLIPDSEK